MTTGEARELAASLRAVLGSVGEAPAEPVAGGCIGESWRWSVGADSAFVKTVPLARSALLEAEAAGLGELAAAGAVRVPRVLGCGASATRAWLALEWLPLEPAGAASDSRFGEQLAALHRVRAANYGWSCDNFIGSTAQANGWLPEWVAFVRDRRLRPQLELAQAGGHGGRWLDRGFELLEAIDVFYASYAPVPSLLHGDLWSGNRAALPDGEPVVYDPAVYFGDREADVAMTRLFGGFGPRFYAAYQSAWPLDAAAGYRRDLHNLYHVLNHLNLFGGGYATQAAAMIGGLLAEAGR